MLLLLGLLFFFCDEPNLCQGEDEGFTFDGDLRQFAVGSDTIYISTEKNLYQLSHNLTLVRRVSLRGVLVIGDRPEDGKFHRVSENDMWNGTFSVNVLLPFVANDTLIICGILDNGCGYCEVLKARNISEVRHRDYILVGPLMDGSASVAFLATVQERRQNETYIMTAIQQAKSTDSRCTTGLESVVFLHNTNDSQKGMIFSDTPKPDFKNKPNSYAEFVDGFQIGLTFYFFANVPSDGGLNVVRLVWLKGLTSKVETMKSLRGATLSVHGAEMNNSRLLASSVIPGGPPVMWSGVFTVNEQDTNTVLVVFDIGTYPEGQPVKDPHFCTETTCDFKDAKSKILYAKTVLIRQNNMTSVLAVRQRDFVVFFIGTGDGQLIKFVMDKNYHISCPRVLYSSHDDRKVLPGLHLDEVDHRHVYVPLKNQLKRIPVTTCNTNTTLEECWSAQDPYCVWCDSTQSCTFEADCNGTDWLGIPDDFRQQKLVSYKTERNSSGQIILKVQTHLTIGPGMVTNFACQFSVSFPLCHRDSPAPSFPQCTCILANNTLPPGGIPVPVRVRLGRSHPLGHLNLTSCPGITGPPTADLCQQCIEAGCGWSSNRCSWANEAATDASICQTVQSGMNLTKPEVHSISPNVVSFYGRNYAVLSGRNLGGVTRVRIQGHMGCNPRECPVLDKTNEALTFHIPSAVNKDSVKVCVVLLDGSCVGDVSITYLSVPSCTDLAPNSSWMSGKRNITVKGSHLELVEAVQHSHAMESMLPPVIFNSTQLTFGASEAGSALTSTVHLKVANDTVTCSKTITYYPDPVFTHFTAALTGSDVSINIQKKADNLEMKTAELSVWGVKDGKQYDCKMENKETNNDTDFFICEIRNSQILDFQHLLIKYGETSFILKPKSSHLLLILLVLLLIPCIIVAVMIIYRRKQNQLTTEMNKLMENLELDIRNDIRQGFIDLQTEKTDLLENVGAIPFLDYKHFASKIFFPESEALMASCIKDIGQDAEKVHLDECCHGLSKLIQDHVFLTSMVHALEEQKSFTIKDKCTLASLLTVALHSNLSYLTEVMESLLKDLMQQTSNTQPKLLLRRTESIVEKLLTNWMSICLYGFLRENVGQHLFLMVSALTQQISKGPVDCVTEKALYTLSEDWLLWQAQDFSSLKLKVLFAVGTDGEVSEPLEVNALTCDTIEQVKEKILSTFKAKFGFPYNTPLRDIDIEFERAGSFVRLEEVDASSEVLGDVTMLNTLKHYKVTDGATIKVLSKKTHPPVSPQGSLKDDQNFSGKYFHLIDPDVDEDQRKNPERKKLKLKEVHLTKLLSTKVAVHSFVENLFRCIWGMQQSKAPHAIKYFFDFLDAQAENMKITDPDVLHIWKTNSLPLRFWVNILKNPQFVFDMEKSPHLDGCLSVIAQAFMDSFSLSDTQLGKHTPTNKLLYTKDTPKFKQEVKVYYKQIREQQPITASEFKDFLLSESKKHDNEFNEAEALRELYKFIQKYFTEIQEKLSQSGAPSEIKEQLHHVKDLFDGLKSCSWN